MRSSRRCAVGAAALALLAALPAAAQVPLTPAAVGMGGAYVAAARGQEALFVNPANLGLPGTPHWSAAVPTVVAGAGVRGLTVGEFADLVRFDRLDEGERRALLDAVPAAGTGADVELRAPLLALQVRRFAVGIGYGVVGSHTVDRSIVDLVLTGFDPAKEYRIGDTEGFRAAYWDFAAAYGRRVGPVSVGATARYLRSNVMVRSALVSLDTVFAGPIPTDLRATYEGVRAPGGSGFGLDLGIAARPMPGLTVGASVENVANTLRWDPALRVRTVVLDQGDYRDGDPEAILGRYEESGRPYVEAEAGARTRAMAARLREDVERGLPPVLRLGAAYRPGTGTTASAAYREELETSPFSGMWPRQLAVGVEQRIPFVTLRAGAASDLDAGGMLSGGIGLGPVQLGVARVSRGTGDGRREGWIASVGLAGRSDSVMR
jgi:hypothetical protein